MWGGDAMINRYMNEYVIPQLKNQHQIDLKISYGQGNDIVRQISTEKIAGKKKGSADLVWINGETFFQLRQIEGLQGPWVNELSNASHLNLDNPFIHTDFQQPIQGMECPWGTVQFAFIYNPDKISNPPLNREELLEFVQKNPEKFTLDKSFTGLTLLKMWLIDISGNPDELYGPFDEEKYNRYSQLLWEYLSQLRPYLWRKGTSFPDGPATMHQMFATGELWMTMSNNHFERENKIALGVFPENTQSYVPNYGSIKNSHYVGIPFNAPNPEGAKLVADFLISPEAQQKKSDPSVWGDGTVLKPEILGNSKHPFEEKALMELAPEYMIRLAEDFNRFIAEQ
jgi:putative spermidine/putrescine transport system substrate-binding protein